MGLRLTGGLAGGAAALGAEFAFAIFATLGTLEQLSAALVAEDAVILYVGVAVWTWGECCHISRGLSWLDLHIRGFEDIEPVTFEAGHFHFLAQTPALVDEHLVDKVACFASIGEVTGFVSDEFHEIVVHG